MVLGKRMSEISEYFSKKSLCIWAREEVEALNAGCELQFTILILPGHVLA